MKNPQALLLDMGGVVLDMAGGRGFPHGRLDWRGREALLQLIRSKHGSATMESLERELFGPWRRQYNQRSETLREADWQPHLERLRTAAGVELSNQALLEAWFRPYSEQLRPIEGVAQALRELADLSIPIALVSNVPLPGGHYRQVLVRYDLDRFFEHHFFSYDLQSRKPSPAMVRQAAAALGAEACETMMVGDRRDRDVLAGQLAGTATVWIHSPDGGGPPADHTIQALADLPTLIRRRER